MDTFNLQLGAQYLSALGPGGAPASAAVRAVGFALIQRGKPYVFGASGTGSYDCSSLVQESYRYASISLPRKARPQWRIMRPVQVNAYFPVTYFFPTDRNNWDTIHHVGTYLGNGEMIHAPQSGDVVGSRPSGGWSSSAPPGWSARCRRANPEPSPPLRPASEPRHEARKPNCPLLNRRRAIRP
ncbi:C40 family peptidase [Fodinicola feengrottensis]|uniref:NlpC/P60 domain-containing protein n=1 Tax=Fodinicola feengrottensis TaxID=435914 RepID=A0ABN2GL78_9ACTN|nr:NlpC/P60 family protein [Fodinicola feengrottensis]